MCDEMIVRNLFTRSAMMCKYDPMLFNSCMLNSLFQHTWINI